MKKIFTANLIDTAARWLQITLILKFFGTESFGVYSYVIAILTPIYLFSNFSLRNICATDIEEAYPINSLFNIRLYLNFIALAAAAILVVFVNANYLMLTLILSLIKCTEGTADIFSGYQQRTKQYGLTGIGLSVRAAIGVAALVVALVTKVSLEVAFLVQWILISISVYMIEYRSYIKEGHTISISRFPITIFKSLFKNGLSLAVSSSVISVTVNLPRYFLESYASLRTLGIISGYLNTIRIGTIFVSSVGYVSLSELSKKWFENDIPKFLKHLKLNLIRISGASAVILLGCIVFRKYIILILFNKDYLEVSYFLIWVAILAFVNYIAGFLGIVMNSIKEYRIILLANCGSLIVALLVGISTIKVVDPYVFTSIMWLIPFLLQIVCFGFLLRRKVRAKLLHL